MPDIAGKSCIGPDRVALRRKSADILIVGAGAAGCFLAYLLRQCGRDVTIAERLRADDKDKLCGGVLTPSAQRLIAEVYGPHTLDELEAIHLDTMRVLYRELEASIPLDAFRVLPRAKLDAYLREQAIASGAALIEHAPVVRVDETSHVATVRDLITGEEETLPYGILVAADGARSTVRKLVTGHVPRTVVSLEAQAASLAHGPHITQRVYPGIAGGCWHIPQGRTAVIGCLFFPESSHEPVGSQRARLLAFGDELGCDMGKLRGAPIPTGDDILLRSSMGTFFVGDAAGLVNPALGAGIHFALQSSHALAQDLTSSSCYEDAMARSVARIQENTQRVFNPYLLLGVKALRANAPE